MAKKKVKKRKANRKNITLFLIITLSIGFLTYYIYNIKISSITVEGNTLYKDWEIIKLAGLENYPSSMQNLSGMITHKLEKAPFIKKAKVSRKWLTNVNIIIEENKPLFYYVPESGNVLICGKLYLLLIRLIGTE